MRKQFEQSLCSIPEFFYLIVNTIKSCYSMLFLIFCMVFLCSFYIVKPLNSTLDYCIKNNVVNKISTNVINMNNKNSESIKTASKLLNSYTNISEIDMNTLNDYVDTLVNNGQLDVNSLEKLINSNLTNGLISPDDLNGLLESNTNKTDNKKTIQEESQKEKQKKEEKPEDPFKFLNYVTAFIAIVFCSMFIVMIGYIVRHYVDEQELNINEMMELAFKKFIQISLFYCVIISTFGLLLFLLDTFIKGNMMFFNITFIVLIIIVLVAIVAYLILSIRLVFILPIIGLLEFGFLKSLSESLYLTKRFTLSSMLRSVFCMLMCSLAYMITYTLFKDTKSYFIFALIFSVIVIFSSIYHSLLALNLSCLLNPEQYDFDNIVNDYSYYEPEKAENLWSGHLNVDPLYEDDDIIYEDTEKDKSIYVNLAILKNEMDCVTKEQSSNKFIY